MILVLWVMVILAGGIVWVRFPRMSVVAVGFAGFLAYTFPALIGYTRPITLRGLLPYLEPASAEATAALVIAWFGFAVSLYFIGVDRVPVSYEVHPKRIKWFIRCAILVSLACYGIMAARGGLAWYELEREEITERVSGVVTFIWRWTNCLGLIVSVYFADGLFVRKKRFEQSFFVLMLALNALGGDRTVVVIAIMALAVTWMWNWPLKKVAVSWRTWGSGLIVLAIVFFMKPLYISVKRGIPLSETLGAQNTTSLIASWEAFGVQENLEGVIRSGLSYSLWNTIRDTLAQLLLQPSIFGMDSLGFNRLLQEQIFTGATYGLAGTYVGQGFAVGGFFGVFIFGFLYGLSLGAIHRITVTCRGMLFFLLIIVGCVIGVYAHRNSLENVLALARQSVVAFLILQALVWLILAGRYHGSRQTNQTQQ